MASTKYLDYDGLLYFWTLIKAKLALKADAQSVTAGSYGPSANVSPAHGGNFKVPYVQVTSQGVVTAISEKTITLPSDNNTDTLVTQNVSTANEEHPILLTVTKDAASNQGAKTSIFASGVKVNPSTNTVTATKFKGALEGNASTATNVAWSGVTSKPTTISGYGITDAYTKSEIDTKMTSAMHYKGSVSTVSNLPSTGNAVGDFYNVTATGENYAWTGSAWDVTGSIVDLVSITNSEIDTIVAS